MRVRMTPILVQFYFQNFAFAFAWQAADRGRFYFSLRIMPEIFKTVQFHLKTKVRRVD
ncbi:hypothetical protein E6C60_3118 [Paenibacillus algicola]|uniref:Uncharacterized protein n=1 Tax=Paenibacillus algicola TaxID=2565926 RepID=A0A4P8XT05_9BACL|nr:hypothetical protein E6C60_3118 [Paenibacillus algicola]